MVYHEVTKGIPQQLQLLKLPLGLRKHQEGAIPDASAAPRWRLFMQLLPLEVPDIVLVGKHHSWRLGQLSDVHKFRNSAFFLRDVYGLDKIAHIAAAALR